MCPRLHAAAGPCSLQLASCSACRQCVGAVLTVFRLLELVSRTSTWVLGLFSSSGELVSSGMAPNRFYINPSTIRAN
jgi:hypothetical protein